MTPTLEAVVAALETLSDRVESLTEGKDLNAQGLSELKAGVDAMRHTVDNPANPKNLRDESVRSHSRHDGHDERFRTMNTAEQGGKAAAIIRASRGTLREALGGSKVALALLLLGAPFTLVVVVAIILAVSGQLDDTIAAVRGTSETTIEAPDATIDAPEATINP